MKDLIEKLAQADGPSRELDAEISRALAGGPADHWYQDHRGAYVTDNCAPCYTASIDAALTLADSEDDPLDLLEEALASCRDERDGVAFLPLHICIAALSAKEPSQ